MTSLTLIAGSGLGLVLVLAGSYKVIRPRGAAVAMFRFRLVRTVNDWHGRRAGGVEVGVGLGLILFIEAPAAWVAAFSLCVLFLFIVGRAVVAGERFRCACFGPSSDELGWRSLLRATSLVGVSLFGLVGTAALRTDTSSLADRVEAVLVGALAVSVAAILATLQRERPFQEVSQGSGSRGDHGYA